MVSYPVTWQRVVCTQSESLLSSCCFCPPETLRQQGTTIHRVIDHQREQSQNPRDLLRSPAISRDPGVPDPETPVEIPAIYRTPKTGDASTRRERRSSLEIVDPRRSTNADWLSCPMIGARPSFWPMNPLSGAHGWWKRCSLSSVRSSVFPA